MKLCMFHPLGHPLERGWVGRVEDDRVVQLAAQTLQAFFTGGGTAREHAEYPLAAVRFLAPVLHPPAVRVFDEQESFAFANPAAVRGPDAQIPAGGALAVAPRLAAVVGADGALGGFTVFAEWRDLARRAPKDRDFAFGLGPFVVTGDALDPAAAHAVVRLEGREALRGGPPSFDWPDALHLAAERTRLFPGDVLAGPAYGLVEAVAPGSRVEVELAGIGPLTQLP